MSHGGENGEIHAADDKYPVQELWENFLGDNCKSLIGKPKLFFIQACRGSNIDPGVSLKHKFSDELQVDSTETVNVIPKLADLLVMYSTAEGHYSFRNTVYGSWFIQALCKELKAGLQENFMHILTRVNKSVAFEKQSKTTTNIELDGAKQMPNIVSMLTKSIFFFDKSLTSTFSSFETVTSVDSISSVDRVLKGNKPKYIQRSRNTENLCYNMSNANRGIALIFNHPYKHLNNYGVNIDADNLKSVLGKLNFDVRYHFNLNSDDIKDVLKKGTNN